MSIPSEGLRILARVCVQVLGFSALFVISGRALLRAFPTPASLERSSSFERGAGFFVGLSAFQALFVLMSPIVGSATIGMRVALGVLAAVAAWSVRRGGLGPSMPLRAAAVWLGLSCVFAVTCATCWLEPLPGGPWSVDV